MNPYCNDPSFGQWPYNSSCSCCAGGCWEYGDQGNTPDHPTLPCCQNGSCAACGSIAGDAPWLLPKAIGCGRTHLCKAQVQLNLEPDDEPDPVPANGECWDKREVGPLDDHDLPGRPPHTIVCVRARGNTAACVDMTTDTCDTGTDCTKYDLVLRIDIPVEVIVRDCCGFLYCLKSHFNTYLNEDCTSCPLRVRIPLCTKVQNLGDSQLYIKVRVRLCSTTTTEAAAGTTTEEWPSDCFGGHTADTKPVVKLDILIEACVVRLVAYGNQGNDPYACPPWAAGAGAGANGTVSSTVGLACNGGYNGSGCLCGG